MVRKAVSWFSNKMKGADLFFESVDTPLDRLSLNREDKKHYIIHGHGDENHLVTFGPNMRNYTVYTAEDVANIVRSDSNWNGRSIKLYVCRAGRTTNTPTPFAQQLANELGVGVSAPNNFLKNGGGLGWFISPDSNPTPTVDPNGKWNHFK